MGTLDAEHRQEILALAEWTEGLACITRGRMQHAAAGLDRAASAFRNIGQARHAALTQVPKIMALSMLGRAVPQMNVFAESFPIRTLVGLTIFGTTSTFMAQHMLNYLRRLPEDTLRVMQLLGTA